MPNRPFRFGCKGREKFNTKETFSLFFYCFWQITPIFLNRTLPKPESSVPQAFSPPSAGLFTDETFFLQIVQNSLSDKAKSRFPILSFTIFFIILHGQSITITHAPIRPPAGTGSREAYPEGKKTPAFPSGFPH